MGKPAASALNRGTIAYFNVIRNNWENKLNGDKKNFKTSVPLQCRKVLPRLTLIIASKCSSRRSSLTFSNQASSSMHIMALLQDIITGLVDRALCFRYDFFCFAFIAPPATSLQLEFSERAFQIRNRSPRSFFPNSEYETRRL